MLKCANFLEMFTLIELKGITFVWRSEFKKALNYGACVKDTNDVHFRVHLSEFDSFISVYQQQKVSTTFG